MITSARWPVVYKERFVEQPDKIFKMLKEELQWVRRENVPRCEYYVNDHNIPYTYGHGAHARTYEPQAQNPVITTLRMLLEMYTNTKFEVCFLNMYLTQKDQLGWHADDSPEMDDSRPIAIISLGVEREIWFRANDRPEVQQLKLGNGSLCLMAPGMQDTHKHRIPKASFACGERISLTFRGFNLDAVQRPDVNPMP